MSFYVFKISTVSPQHTSTCCYSFVLFSFSSRLNVEQSTAEKCQLFSQTQLYIQSAICLKTITLIIILFVFVYFPGKMSTTLQVLKSLNLPQGSTKNVRDMLDESHKRTKNLESLATNTSTKHLPITRLAVYYELGHLKR